MFTFDARSIDRLTRLDPALAGIMYVAIQRTPFAWRIVQTDRTIEQQREYFLAGRSKVNPDKYPDPMVLYKKAKHITGPGMPLARAVDICIRGAEPYDVDKLTAVWEVVKDVAARRKVPVRWGGEFTTIRDLPHFELA